MPRTELWSLTRPAHVDSTVRDTLDSARGDWTGAQVLPLLPLWFLASQTDLTYSEWGLGSNPPEGTVAERSFHMKAGSERTAG